VSLGLSATDPARFTWEPVKSGDPDHMPNGQPLLHVVADRIDGKPHSNKPAGDPQRRPSPHPEATRRAA